MGMLAAVEMWVKRDHDGEWKRWMAWLDHISRRVSAINGVTTNVTQPGGLSNRTPSLRVWWDPQRFGFSGDTVVRTLFETEPRISLTAGRRARAACGDGCRHHSVHDVARRRNDRGGQAARTADVRCASRSRCRERCGCGRFERPLECPYRIRVRFVEPRAASQAARQRRGRHASG